MKDFNPDRIKPIAEERLKYYADTSLTLPRLAEMSGDHQRLDSLIYYAEWLKNYNEGIALFYAEQAYDLATEKNWNFPRATSAYRVASIKRLKARLGEDIEDALVDARISERLFSTYNDDTWNIRVNILLGQLFIGKSNIDTARYYFEKALFGISNIEDDSLIVNEQKAFIFHDLGRTYIEGNIQKSLDFFSKSDILYKELNNKKGLARLWLDQARIYLLKKDYITVDSLYDQCLESGNQYNDINLLALTHQLKGHLFYQLFYDSEERKDFNKAIEHLRKSLKFEYEQHSWTYEYLGASFHTAWFFDIDETYADSAAYYYSLAITEASKNGASSQINNSSVNLASLCSSEKIDCDVILGDNIFNFINNNYLALVDTITSHSKGAYQRINKVEQRDLKVNAANKRKNQLYISLGILILSITAFLFLYQRQQNRRLKAEMDALRAQINPHFISNSLNAIESLVNLGNAKAAAKYLVHFSRLSRRILNGSRSAMTSLGDELKTLEHFLALEQLRFRDKLSYNIQVEENVKQELIEVPAMILQPYVENAIWHGIKPKAEGGNVGINIRKEGKVLICEIEDDGIGRKRSMELRDASILKHKSMGMQITEERLKAMGRVKGSQVTIQDLKDSEGNSLGTKVIVKFPIKLKKRKG